MRRIDQPQLRLLVTTNVIRERDTDRLPVGSAATKAAFEHPLHECLALNGPTILYAEHLPDGPCELGRRGRRNAVDHGAREEHLVLDPRREPCVDFARESYGGVGQLSSVVFEV